MELTPAKSDDATSPLGNGPDGVYDRAEYLYRVTVSVRNTNERAIFIAVGACARDTRMGLQLKFTCPGATAPSRRSKYYETFKSAFVWKHPELLEENGITLVTDDPDFVFINYKEFHPEFVASLPAPVLVEDATDGVALGGLRRMALAHPKVAAVFREVDFRDSRYHNGKTYAGDYAAGLRGEAMGRKINWYHEQWLDEAALAKIQLVFPLTFSPARVVPTSSLAERSYDLHCVVNAASCGDYRSWYVDQVETVPVRRFVFRAHPPEHKLPHAEYLGTMRDSRIVVSPWGYGLWNWRDYEAILNRCVLLKPDTSMIRAIPDMYDPSDPWYVPHRHDCSDLACQVQAILENLPRYQALVDECQRRLVEALEPARLIRRMAEAIRSVA